MLRRATIQKIILNGLVESDILLFIKQQVEEFVEPKDREELVSVILEDLDGITPSRIAGMGITRAELEAWLVLNAK